MDKFGFDFEQVRALNDSLLEDKTDRALSNNFRRLKGDTVWTEKLEGANLTTNAIPKQPGLEAAKATPSKGWPGGYNSWTDEQDVALKRGMLNHGFDWEKILETETEVLEHRNAASLEKRHEKLLNWERNYNYFDDEGNEVAGDEEILRIAASQEEEENTTTKKRRRSSSSSSSSPPFQSKFVDSSDSSDSDTSSKPSPQKKIKK